MLTKKSWGIYSLTPPPLVWPPLVHNDVWFKKKNKSVNVLIIIILTLLKTSCEIDLFGRPELFTGSINASIKNTVGAKRSSHVLWTYLKWKLPAERATAVLALVFFFLLDPVARGGKRKLWKSNNVPRRSNRPAVVNVRSSVQTLLRI